MGQQQNVVAPCGLYCGACSTYAAGKRGDSERLKEFASLVSQYRGRDHHDARFREPVWSWRCHRGNAIATPEPNVADGLADSRSRFLPCENETDRIR